MRAFEFGLTASRRVQSYIADWRAKAVRRDIEVFERASDEDTSGVDRSFEIPLSINQQNTESLAAEKLSALETSQAGSDDDYVVSFHKQLAL